MNRRNPIRYLALICLLPLTAQAADLLEIYQIAKQNDPTLGAATAGYASAQAAKSQSRAPLLPNATLVISTIDTTAEGMSAGSTPATDSETDLTSLTLRQSLYNHSNWVQYDQGKLGEETARIALEGAKQDLIGRLTSAYFDVLAANDNLQFARAEKKAISRQLEQAQQRFKVGLIAITDVHEAQARFDQSLASEIVAENGVEVAKELLAEIIGQPSGPLAPLGGQLELNRPQPAEIDHWVNQALANNPLLLGAIAQHNIARKEVSRQRAGHYPTLDLVAGYTDTQVADTTIDTQETSIRLELVVPLYSGGATQAGVSQAHEDYRASQHDLERQKRITRSQARQAYLGVIAGLSQVRALAQALESSQTALKATQAGFEAGTRTIVDVLNAQQGLFRAQRDLARAKYDYLLSQLGLKQAAGLLGEADLQQVNRWLKR